MPSPPATIEGTGNVVLKLRAQLTVWAAAAGTAIAWGDFVLKWKTGRSLTEIVHRRAAERARPGDLQFDLIIAVVATVGLWLYAFLSVRKSRDLAVTGRQTSGTVVSKAIVGRYGLVPVTIQYFVEGVEYQRRIDMSADTAVGHVLTVIYDPKRPTRIQTIPLVAG
jgi:hypothetical protein